MAKTGTVPLLSGSNAKAGNNSVVADDRGASDLMEAFTGSGSAARAEVQRAEVMGVEDGLKRNCFQGLLSRKVYPYFIKPAVSGGCLCVGALATFAIAGTGWLVEDRAAAYGLGFLGFILFSCFIALWYYCWQQARMDAYSGSGHYDVEVM